MHLGSLPQQLLEMPPPEIRQARIEFWRSNRQFMPLAFPAIDCFSRPLSFQYVPRLAIGGFRE
jgi:hypothetical protein